MYKQIKTANGQIANEIIRTTDGACIPFDPANTDYQDYLKWLEESPDNKALPADE
jgi:hypothetical protein